MSGNKGLPRLRFPPLVRGDKWWQRARCKGMSAAEMLRIFYPLSRDHHWFKPYETAMGYCQQCPVREECLRDALIEERYDAHGFRGGHTPQERRELYREQRWARRKALAENKKTIPPTLTKEEQK